jgi:hypothetical protein
MTGACKRELMSRIRDRRVKLFLASFLALYFELVIIRYLSAEIRTFAYLKNLPLIASFFGLGIGMVLAEDERRATAAFPLTGLVLFLLIRFAPMIGLTHLPMPDADYMIWGLDRLKIIALLKPIVYMGAISIVSALVVLFCVPLGSLIGKYLKTAPPLWGYGVNLAGSLAGVGVFATLSFLRTLPSVWIGIGSIGLLIFFWERPTARLVFLILPLLIAFPSQNTLWSPYYNISLRPDKILQGEQTPSVIRLSVNHDYHQKILDLSSSFFNRHPSAEPNRSSLLTYDFPYIVHPGAKNVLILGAGTGNDVAAALRHGARSVDAVEIDPVILDIGKTMHPEKPYNSPRVTVHINDARAFLSRAVKRYDLVVFAYLDSHTLLANMSSLRLDNYVYTVEGIEEAKSLLASGGTMVLAFDSGDTFVSGRIYRMLKSVFGYPPLSYFTGYDSAGVVFVSGSVRTSGAAVGATVINGELERLGDHLTPATDNWPFLYLHNRSIPEAYYIIFILLFVGWIIARRVLRITAIWTRSNLYFFSLGAAFLLLETKAVTDLSLLFGSTWVVNTVAIVAFLVMAISANALMMYMSPSRIGVYVLLFAALLLGIIFPAGLLLGLSPIIKLLTAGLIVALPVFFSGMLFSLAFRDTADPSTSLGINLLGALVGGFSENMVMLGGTSLLGILAIAFYAFSFAVTVQR